MRPRGSADVRGATENERHNQRAWNPGPDMCSRHACRGWLLAVHSWVAPQEVANNCALCLTRSFHYTEGAFQKAHGAPLFGRALHVCCRQQKKWKRTRLEFHDQIMDGGRSRLWHKQGNLAWGRKPPVQRAATDACARAPRVSSTRPVARTPSKPPLSPCMGTSRRISSWQQHPLLAGSHPPSANARAEQKVETQSKKETSS